MIASYLGNSNSHWAMKANRPLFVVMLTILSRIKHSRIYTETVTRKKVAGIVVNPSVWLMFC
jgi:hypothetical protein